jgi:hypothetical protein
MYSLLHKLRAAASVSDGDTLKHLLLDAAAEIERLQRMAYRASASRPINFATVQLIREHHLADEMTIDMDGPAAQAHEDRAQLLSVITFMSQETAGGGVARLADAGMRTIEIEVATD